MTSTPTLQSGHIWQAVLGADIEKHYFVPCPHCGEYIELKFSNLRFPSEEGLDNSERADMAVYVCQECGCKITDQDRDRMIRYGEWREVRRSAKTLKSGILDQYAVFAICSIFRNRERISRQQRLSGTSSELCQLMAGRTMGGYKIKDIGRHGHGAADRPERIDCAKLGKLHHRRSRCAAKLFVLEHQSLGTIYHESEYCSWPGAILPGS